MLFCLSIHLAAVKKARFLWEAGRKAIQLIGIEGFHPVLFQNPDDVILLI